MQSSGRLSTNDMDDRERNHLVRGVFNMLDELSKLSTSSVKNGDGKINETDIKRVVYKHMEKTNVFTSCHAQRLTHFILVLNTKLDNCDMVTNDVVLKNHIHGKLLHHNVYCKIVVTLKLRPFMTETIMFTPVSFCKDLIESNLDIIDTMKGLSQITAYEDLLIAILKNAKQMSVQNGEEVYLTKNFNQALMLFGKVSLCTNDNKLNFDEDRNAIELYNGFRLKSIFKIVVEIIKYNISSESKIQFALYESLTSFCNAAISIDGGNGVLIESVNVFQHLFDIVMYKCINMCDFSVDSWLSWYEIEDVYENTSLQSVIGSLCHELCTLIDKGNVKEKCLNEFLPILRNIAIEKVDFSRVDPSDVDGMIDYIDKHSKIHTSDLVKTLMEVNEVFNHPRVIDKLGIYVERVDYECFITIVDCYMKHFKNFDTLFDSPMGGVLLKGIMHLDEKDKINVLKHFCVRYIDCTFKTSNNFSTELEYIVVNECDENANRNELISKLIWLVIQQPRKMFEVLISQRIVGICGLPPKQSISKKSCVDRVVIEMHIGLDVPTIIKEYFSWFDYPIRYIGPENIDNLYHWVVDLTKKFKLIKPKKFLKHVLTPLLYFSSDIRHMTMLVTLTKFFFNECESMTSAINVWDTLAIQLAKMLDEVRWTVDNYSELKSQLCEAIIETIQPIILYGIFSGTSKKLNNTRNEVSSLHLMTRAHFIRMWTSEYITIDGMDEQFIMTIHSKSHISYSNLNANSTQRAQEEFIFSIATYMPRLTLREIKSFIANYMSSVKTAHLEATVFLWNCVMSACMRTIVYLKTAGKYPATDNKAWECLDNLIVNFIDATNGANTNCIFNYEAGPGHILLKFNVVSKILMVIKQLVGTYQVPLMIVSRRLTESIVEHLDAEKVEKLLNMIAPLDKTECKDKLGCVVELLTKKLQSYQSTNNS